jgi:hypothetical protein
MYTKKVAIITEIIGAIAGTQKSFLFFLPYVNETSLVYKISFSVKVVSKIHETKRCLRCTWQTEGKPGKMCQSQ